jgi:uncharacterized membrane protein
MLASISTTEARAEKNQHCAMHANLRLAVLMFAAIYSTAFWVLVLMLAVYLSGIHASNSFFFCAVIVIALLVYSALALVLRGTHTAPTAERQEKV